MELACVTDKLLADPEAGFPICDPPIFGDEGRCIPECLVEDQTLLFQSACAADELCVPCEVGGDSTGVCDG